MRVFPGTFTLSVVKLFEIPRVDVDVNVVIVHKLKSPAISSWVLRFHLTCIFAGIPSPDCRRAPEIGHDWRDSHRYCTEAYLQGNASLKA